MEFFVSTNEELYKKERKSSDLDSNDGSINNTKANYSSANINANAACSEPFAQMDLEITDTFESDKVINKEDNEEKEEIFEEVKENKGENLKEKSENIDESESNPEKNQVDNHKMEKEKEMEIDISDNHENINQNANTNTNTNEEGKFFFIIIRIFF
jgi:hypothetical protein